MAGETLVGAKDVAPAACARAPRGARGGGEDGGGVEIAMICAAATYRRL